MTSVFELDSSGMAKADADENVVAPSDVTLGFWHKVLPGGGLGIMRGGARVGQFVGMAGGALQRMATALPQSERELMSEADIAAYEAARDEQTDRYFRQVDRHITSAVDFWTPRADEIGTAGRVLGGLSEAVLPLMATGGNPALLIGSQEMGTATDLVREGVSAPAAVGTGIVQGAATAVGFRMPFLGKTLSQRIVSGAAGNVAVGAGTALGSRELLKSLGETEAAQRFNPLDVEGRAVDILTGLAFGGIAHVQMRSAERNAVLTSANARHFQEDTAPGVPADLNSAVAHQKAMESATMSLLNGEPVTAPAAVTDATFSPHEFVERSLKERAAALDEHLATEKAPATSPIPVAEHLPPEQRAIESRFREQIGSRLDEAVQAYAKLEDSQGGKVLNTDVARELSPDYLKDRTLSAAVHEPASYLVKEMYARKLAEEPAPGERPTVLFSAGGTGAGKTTGLKALPDLVASAQIIYDTNMNKLTSAIQKIDQALEAGKNATVVYTYREPIEALTKGALPRAMRQVKKFGSGRTVPVNEHIGTHVGSREVIDQLAAHYAGDKRVQILAVDNSRGKAGVRMGTKGVEMASGGPRVVPLSEIPKLGEGAYNSLRERAIKELESAHSSGAISEAVHRGFAGEDVARGMVKESRPGDRGQPQPADSGRRVDDPLTAAVRERLTESDIRIPTGELDADGNPVTRSAREALAEADAGIVEAESMGHAVMAAVTCFVQRGLS